MKSIGGDVKLSLTGINLFTAGDELSWPTARQQSTSNVEEIIFVSCYVEVELSIQGLCCIRGKLRFSK